MNVLDTLVALENSGLFTRLQNNRKSINGMPCRYLSGQLEMMFSFNHLIIESCTFSIFCSSSSS